MNRLAYIQLILFIVCCALYSGPATGQSAVHSGECSSSFSGEFNEEHALLHIRAVTSNVEQQLELLEKARKRFDRYPFGKEQTRNTSPSARSKTNKSGGSRSDGFNCETDNWDFENGTLDGWDYEGVVSIVSEGTDPYGGYDWVYPGGGNFSAKISSDQYGAMNDGRLSREIYVPPTGVTYFSFHFAMSIFNFPHTAYEASKFYVEFYDENDQLIPCPNFVCFFSDDLGPQGVDGFEVTPMAAAYYNPNASGDQPYNYGVSYTHWQDVTLDLSGYAGQTLRVEFRVEWCIYGPDWSYALIEVDCPVNNGIPNTVCSDYPQQICGIGAGTGNFQSYEWYDQDNNFLGNDECIMVNEPGSYFCTVLPIDVDCTEGSAITIEYQSMPMPSADFSASNANAPICVGDVVDFTNQSTFPGEMTSTWHLGDGTVIEANNISHTFIEPGEFTISLAVVGNECTDTETMIIEVLPYPEAGFTSELQCGSTSVIFTDATIQSYGQPNQWEWDFNGDGQPDSFEQHPTYNFPASGNYPVTLRVANEAGCSDEFTSVVYVPTPLTAVITNLSDYNGYHISCHGASDGSFAITPSGGSGSYTISVNGNAYGHNELITDLPAGNYLAVISDDECEIELNVLLTEPQLLSADIAVISDYNGFDISCFEMADGMVQANVQGGIAPYGFSWSNGSETPQTDNLAADEISVIITDLNGCETSVSTLLNDPPPIALEVLSLSDYNGYNVSCFNGSNGQVSVEGEGGVGNLSWTYNGLTGSDQMTGLQAGNITVMGTDLNGCSASLNVLLTQPPQLNCDLEILTDYNGYHVSCPENADGAAQISMSGGVGPYLTTWADGATDYTHTQLSAGENQVTVIDQNNCVSLCAVTLEAPPALITTFEIRPDTCQHSSGEITIISAGGVTPYEFQWSSEVSGLDLDGSEAQSNLPEGNYTVTVTDQNQCVLTSTVALPSVAPATVKIGLTGFPACNEKELSFYYHSDRDLQEFSWIFPDGSVSANSKPTYFFDDPGEYTVYFESTDVYNCLVQTEMNLEVLPGMRIYVPNSFTPNEDGINDLFGPKSVGVIDYHLEIFNRWGESVFESFDPDEKWNGESPRGSHYVQNEVYVYRLVVSGNCESSVERTGTVTAIR